MSDAPRRRLAAIPDTPKGRGRAAARRTGKPTTTTPAAAIGGAHGPYSRPPRSPALLAGERQPMLAEVLQGVRLGAYDRQALDWLCRWLDTPTFLALLGLVHRARQAAAERAVAAAGRPAADGQPAGPSPASTRARTARGRHPRTREEGAP